MEKRRIVALIGAIIIPVMLLVSIILSIMDSPIAVAFLYATIVIAIVFPVIVYLLTKYPGHIRDFYFRLKDGGEEKIEASTKDIGKQKKKSEK